MAKEPDPRVELAALAASLAGARELACGYVLRGAERYFRERALELVLERARTLGWELCRHDTKDSDFRLQALSDDLTSQGLFASSRCVVIAEPEAVIKKSADAEAPIARALKSFLAARRGAVVLTADSLRADNACVKELVAAGGVAHTFRRLYERPGPWERDQDPRRSELVGFVVGRARELSIALTPDRALLLVHAHGNDVAALDTVLRSAAERRADPLAGLGATAAGSPGEVADALITGDLPRAQLALENLFGGGMRKEKDGSRETAAEALNAILLGYLRPRVRQGLAVAQARSAGATLEAAIAEAGVTGFDRGLREAIGAREPRAWSAMLDDLLELERGARTGASVDVNHWTRLALKWRVRSKTPARGTRA